MNDTGNERNQLSVESIDMEIEVILPGLLL